MKRTKQNGRVSKCQVRSALKSVASLFMSVIRAFEDLVAWQEARKLTNMVYSMVNTQPIRRDFGLCDQLRRAAVSVMANIAEGFDCESRTEFARFLAIARRSAVEIQSLLYAALDNKMMDKASFDRLLGQAQRTKRIIHALKASLQRPAKTTPHSSPDTRHPPTPAQPDPMTPDTRSHRPSPAQ